ncbi:MAG TPA: hypothetical protein VHM26_09860 [Chitinophagaceae bacterium]|jgi:hypothetical protein|nr:hypothetical protein [Chitinophagaceae bacterium]
MLNKSVLIALLMVFIHRSVSAQQDFLKEPDRNRPSLFSNVPETVSIPVALLDHVSSLTTGSAVDISLGGTFHYKGTVASSTVQNEGKLLTVIVTSSTGPSGPTLPGSFLTLSRVVHDDKTISYIARILSFQHADCMVLKENADHSYSFIKKKFYDIVGE